MPKAVNPAQTAGNQQALQQKVEELTARNNELQAELTMMQMQESQTIASTKPIGADDLRMEFLNFTSAHIQQFNTRIKRTEELIESQIQKNQQPSENKNRKEFPQWLYWTNLAALALIAVYCLFSMFRPNPGSTAIQAAQTSETVKAQPNAALSVKAAVTEEKVNKELPEQKTAPQVAVAASTFSATASNAESASTPFHKTAEVPAAVPVNTPVRSMPAQNAVPVRQNIQQLSPQTAAKPKSLSGPKVAAKPTQAPVPVKTKAAPAADRTPVKQQLTVSSKPAKTEKKAAPQEKVYFGED
jgi:hypothetical protein